MVLGGYIWGDLNLHGNNSDFCWWIPHLTSSFHSSASFRSAEKKQHLPEKKRHPCHHNLHLFYFHTRHETTTTSRRSNNSNNLGLLHWGRDDAHGQWHRIVASIVLLMVTGLGFFLALSLLYPWQDVGTGRFCFHSHACSWPGKGCVFTHWSWWES